MKEDEKWIKAFKDKLEDYSEPMPASGALKPVAKRI